MTNIHTKESAKILSELQQSNSTYIKAWKELSEYYSSSGKNSNRFCSATNLWISTISTIWPATAVSESCIVLYLRCNSERQDKSKQQNYINLTIVYIYEPHIRSQSTSIQEALPKSGSLAKVRNYINSEIVEYYDCRLYHAPLMLQILYTSKERKRICCEMIQVSSWWKLFNIKCKLLW